ncbi:MAG: DUF5103 domain-containing protein [Bacteroidia bacterium]|jgi:hypothetical protein|nr:DUF5103 domain-containing protein [Bacteroidia bacterium]
MKYWLWFSLAWAVPLTDTICEPHIYTVQFYRGENTLSFPFLGLREDNYLTLEFDEVAEEAPSDFWVRIQLCSRTWEPSSLPLTEYWPAFVSDRITEFVPSYNTRVGYVHYRYRLRNAFQRSGFYVVEVFRENDPKRLVLRRRFYVVENVVKVQPDLSGQVVTGQRQRFQTIAFSVFPGPLNSTQAYQEFFCMLLQNGRWDNARAGLKPTFLYPDHLEYRFQAGLDMPAGVEFRMLDLRSILRRRSFQVERTFWTDSGIVVRLVAEQPRAGLAYTSQFDLNGRFFIQIQDALLDTVRLWQGRDELSSVQADYFWVEFRLQASTPYEKPLYVVGDFMGWRPDPRFQLTYDEQRGEYRGRILLKQGVYDYLYAVWDAEKGSFDPEPVEGSYFEAENLYAVLVGYRGFTDREDRVVGHRWLNYYEP